MYEALRSGDVVWRIVSEGYMARFPTTEIQKGCGVCEMLKIACLKLAVAAEATSHMIG
jgi:hypothetical protein